MRSIDHLTKLWEQLEERMYYLRSYNEANGIGYGAESYDEHYRLLNGWVHFNAKFTALIAEMQELLYLGGEVKTVHEVVGAAVQKELDAVLGEVRKGQSDDQ